MRSLLARLTPLHSDNVDLWRKWLTFKNGTYFDLSLYFYNNCVIAGARKMPIKYMFCFICAYKLFCRAKKCSLPSFVFKKIIPNNTTPPL